MTFETYWTIPTRGDGRSGDPSRWRRGEWNTRDTQRTAPGVTDPRVGRSAHGNYLSQVARAAEATGFTGLFVPYDPLGEESWVLATALAREASRLRVVPEIQPGFATAVYSAKLALSFQRFFHDRLDWKLVIDTEPELQRRVGDLVVGADRLARAEEFLVVTSGVWNEASFTYLGQHFEVEGGGFFGNESAATADVAVARPSATGSSQPPAPRVFLDGVSDAEIELSARFADVHVFDIVDPVELAVAVDRHRARASAHGRSVRYALRTAVLVREYSDEAWRDAARLWADVAQSNAAGFEALRSGAVRWAGFDRIGGTVAGGLVGSFDHVIDALSDYVRSGIDAFILDGIPRLEEVYRLGEFVLPYVHLALLEGANR